MNDWNVWNVLVELECLWKVLQLECLECLVGLCRLDRRSPCLLYVELVLEESLGFLRVEWME